MDRQRTHWAEYLSMYIKDPLSGQLLTFGFQNNEMLNHPLMKIHPLLIRSREAVARLKSGKAAGICYISVELLKVRGEAMIQL